MSIFIDKGTNILVQGITGREGAFWTEHILGMGARVVAGVTPGKAGQSVRGVPVFNTVSDALSVSADTGQSIHASILFVPPQFAKDAVFEALDSGVEKIVSIADGIPVQDQIEIRAAARSAGAQVVGANSSGVISPGKSMAGMFPYWIERVYKPGSIGVMTRSGSLTNEVSAMVVREGFGLSTLIGVGGDPVPASRFADFLPQFQEDVDTEALVIVGELGGTMEEEVAEAVSTGMFTKPLVAFIGGRRAPAGKKMGHAGAIVNGSAGTVASKTALLREAGALVAERPSQVGAYLKELLAE